MKTLRHVATVFGKGTNWTAPHEPIAVLKDTPTTPARLQKYQKRFGHAHEDTAPLVL